VTYFTLWIWVKYFLFLHSWLAYLLNIACVCVCVCIYTRWFKYDRDCLHLFTYKLVPVILEPPCIYIGPSFRVGCPTVDTQWSTELHNSWNISHSATLLALTYFTQFIRDGLVFAIKSYPDSNNTIKTTSSIIYVSRIMQWLSYLHKLISFVRHNLCKTLELYIFICKM
jgi:hypothetical protein